MLRPEKEHSLQNEFLAPHTFMYSHLHLIAFPLSSVAAKERLKHLLGSAYTLQKDVERVEINLLQKLDQFLISESTALGSACGPWVASTSAAAAVDQCPEGEHMETG